MGEKRRNGITGFISQFLSHPNMISSCQSGVTSSSARPWNMMSGSSQIHNEVLWFFRGWAMSSCLCECSALLEELGEGFDALRMDDLTPDGESL